MLLRVFTKRTKGGEQVQTSLEWKEWLFEGSQIFKKDIVRENEGEPKEHIGFEFKIVKGEESTPFTMFSSIMGYEILSGCDIIERYVTAVEGD